VSFDHEVPINVDGVIVAQVEDRASAAGFLQQLRVLHRYWLVVTCGPLLGAELSVDALRERVQRDFAMAPYPVA